MTKKTIEEVINVTLKKDSLKNVLELITWLRENKMNPAQSSKTTWKINLKSCVVCYFRFDFDKNDLRITPFICEYEHDSLSENLKEIVWENAIREKNCHGSCRCSYKLKTIFGRKDFYACAQVITFTNPTASEIECIKVLIKMRENVLRNGKLMSTLPRNFEYTLTNKQGETI
jgi:hypothetical protein